jgi:hypothetical protein
MKKLLLLLVLSYVPNTLFSQDFDWIATAGGIASEQGHSLAIDASGNVYSVGIFKSSLADFDPSDQTFNLSNNGINDIYIQKLDSDGNLVWAKSIGGSQNDGADGIVIDSDNNLYITGFFTGMVDFDPNAGEVNLTATASTNTYILKLNSDGEFIWVRQLEGDTNQGKAIAVDQNNNIYTTGVFFFEVDFDPSGNTHALLSLGSSDFFVQKMDSNGNFMWARSYGGDSAGSNELSRSIAIDNNNNVLLTGQFQNTVDFDPSNNEYELTSNGVHDVFILKLNSNGSLVWARNIGGTDSDSGSSILTDNLNNVYITGYFRDTVDFNPSSDITNISAHPDDEFGDIFILKLNSNGGFLWAHGYGGEGKDEGQSLTIDQINNLYIVSDFKFTVDFDPSSNVEEFSTFNGDAASDISIQKFDGNGILQWVRVLGGPNGDYAYSISHVDNRVHITGYFEETVDFDPSNNDFEVTSNGFKDVFLLSLNDETLSVQDDERPIISIYPNPTDRFFQIEPSLIIQEVQVYSYLGKELKVVLENGFIDLVNIDNGIYVIKVITNKGIVKKK